MSDYNMLQAIQTKFMPPTNFRGSRVKAWCQARGIVLDWDHSLGVDENHKKAAETLFKAMGWDRDGKHVLRGGALPKPASGYAFVIVPRIIDLD